MNMQCPTCGGSGQLSFFQGVSRFLLTWEECPCCCGTGFVEHGVKEAGSGEIKSSAHGKRRGKNKKEQG